MNDLFVNYAIAKHSDDLVKILKEIDVAKHYPVVINALLLFEAHMEVSQFLLKNPEAFLSRFDEALLRASESIYDSHPLKNDMILKSNLHARISGMPICPELSRDFLPKAADIGHFLSFSGTVTRVGLPKLLESHKQYQCSQCKYTFMVKADLQRFLTADKPKNCPNPAGCDSYKFLPSNNHDPQQLRDYQEIKIQERVQALQMRSVPRTVWIILKDDLVDSCQPGDDVTVVGTVVCRWQPLIQDAKCNVEYAVDSNYIHVNNSSQSHCILTDEMKDEFKRFWQRHKQKPLIGRNEILMNFCPQIYGLYQVKLAVALVLAGGVSKMNESGTRIRGDCHLLLIGDPGTGKSLFLKYAAKICPRSVFTNGIGSTSAGLTVTAVKDGGEWQLEAGALVLADGGLCCIDELNSMREHDRACILEAMEQQTISVAKAGILCKMNSQCTVLAATNPKGCYDRNASISVNVALSSPLLSRFDLILILLDSKKEEWHRLVSWSMLQRCDSPGPTRSYDSSWSLDKMQSYFCLIKQLKPVMTPEAHIILQRYYVYYRQKESTNASRATVRMLDSMIRLSEAHAKLLFKSQVTVMDAITAITVMEVSMQGAFCFDDEFAVQTTFPNDPEEDYRKQVQIVLRKLQLDDLLEKELGRVVNNCQEISGISSSGSDCPEGHDVAPLTLESPLRTDCNGQETLQQGYDAEWNTSTPVLQQQLDNSETYKTDVDNIEVVHELSQKRAVEPSNSGAGTWCKKMKCDTATQNRSPSSDKSTSSISLKTMSMLKAFSFENGPCPSPNGGTEQSRTTGKKYEDDDIIREDDLNLSWLD